MANVTKMPPPETPETPDSSPEIEAAPTPTTPEPAKKRKGGPGRGHTKDGADKPAKSAEFFAQVAAIPDAEWGQRAFMYVYIDEPVLQANTWGKYTYAKKLHKPIFDLDPIKDWYGSCKGWVSLNFRKSTKQSGDQMATLEFEIFDIHVPSKIPRKCWANDQRNLKWEATLPPEKPQQSNGGAGPLIEAINAYRAIREDMKEEMTPEEKPAAAPADPTRNTLETMKLAKELFATNGEGKPAADPLATAISILNTLMQVRAENPMVDMLSKQLEASRAELSKALEQLRTAQAPAPPKGLLEQLTEFAAIADKIEPLRKLFGGGAAETVVRTGRTNGLDILREIAPQFLQSPIAQGLGQLFASMAMKNAAGPPPTVDIPPAAGQPTSETEAQKLSRIGRNISEPLIVEFFEPWANSGGTAQGNSGASYAERINDLWPDDFEYLQSLGADRIIMLFMHHPLTAARLQPRAQQFRQFITEFLAYDPNADEQPAPTPAPKFTGVRDLEAEEASQS